MLLATLMTRGERVAGGDRLGKTIVFAKNTAHAEFIAGRYDANYPEDAGHAARTITYRTEYAQSLIDDFATGGKAPQIAVSVDMLDTGIDVPEVVNLVSKPVRSKTKFWEMIGRGTRLCPNLFGPGEHKRDFRVFDCCQNIEYFNQAGLRADTVALLRARVANMNVDNLLVRPHRKWVEDYRAEQPWDEFDVERAIELADLPSAVRDDDEEAKRFDLIILKLQLCRLLGEPGQERLRRQVQEIASGLLEQLSTPTSASPPTSSGHAARPTDWAVHQIAGRPRPQGRDRSSLGVQQRANPERQPARLHCVDLRHLTLNGTMDPGQLYEPPFTRLASGGPESMFPEADVIALVAAIRAVDESAQPYDAAA